ncbi:hypothetical protein G6F24_018064 [Rhizopus arrhizus]|nr:hypothetical protein G6F24_018064 [Rhizopus arrhizus]
MEIPASQGGVVKEVKVKVGDKVAKGSVVVVVEGAAAAAAPAAKTDAAAAAPAAKAEAKAEAPAAAAPAPANCRTLRRRGASSPANWA